MTDAKEPLGFLGLGLLGLPMATNLAQAGHPLRLYNRTAAKANPLVARGAQHAATPADAVPSAGGIVLSCVWDAAAVEAITTSPGFLARLGRGGIHVSMTTLAPEAAKRIAALHAEAGCVYVEAPVFGRPEAAAAKKLWIPLAGPAAAKARVRPILEALGGQGIFDFGEAPGAAVSVKLAGNFLLMAAARSMVEAIGMAEAQGVDPAAVVHMLTTTLFDAPIYQSYGKLIAEKKLTLGQSKIPAKDLGLFTATAAETGTPTPVGTLLHQLFS